MHRAEIQDEVAALEAGRGFVAHRDLRVTWVSGSEAAAWLNDLVTAAVEDIGPFETRRSLLLSPTGRIRADFHVLGFGDVRPSFLLVQPADQPEDLARALGPYVLSSDVVLRPAPFAVVSIPERSEVPAGIEGVWRPSILGGGFDLLVSGAGGLEATRRKLTDDGLVEGSPQAAEARRIRLGRARFPVDLDSDSLPAEAALDDGVVVDREKGCFLGQEAVAKVRNLGHPTRVVRGLRAAAPVSPGEAVHMDGREVGVVTSAVRDAEGSVLLARVRWEARDAALVTLGGVRLDAR